MLYYLDTSAFVKLVITEPRTNELLAWIKTEQPTFVSSDLLAVEAIRAARRHSPEALTAVRERLTAVTLIRLSSDICDRAGHMDPRVMRSLDALHLATALALGSQMKSVVTYDARMVEACTLVGLEAISP
jgi:uncharacterized protein